MMGERTGAQEALFYGFSLEGMCRPIKCCGRLIGSLISAISASG
jgi:hypothetical protein